MKDWFVIISLLTMSIVSCGTGENINKRQNKVAIETEKCELVKTLKRYKKNILDGDVSRVGGGFNVVNNSDLWRVIYFNLDEEVLDESLLDRSFQVNNDFKKHFDDIFTYSFVKCFESLSVQDLIDRGEYVTTKINLDKYGVCWITALYDKTKSSIILVLSHEFSDEGEKYEVSVNYTYEVIDCEIVLAELLLLN
jgi:hypothetical protein